MRRGFTIIEILIVVTIMVILSTIAIAGYKIYEDRAFDSQARSLANDVSSAVERYYNLNNEYPSAETVFGGVTTNSVPASYLTASTVLDISTSILDSSNVKLIPCAGVSCGGDITKVYYVTKTNADGTTSRMNQFGSCQYTFPTGESGSLSYLITFWSRQNNRWEVVRGKNGGVVTQSITTCPFRAL